MCGLFLFWQNYVIRGPDFITFPVVPTVTAVTGCAQQVGNTTQRCPTDGGPTLTIYGSDFIQNGLSVAINGNPCTLPIVSDGNSVIRCALPAGAGLKRNVVVNSLGQNSVAKALVYYARTLPRVLLRALCLRAPGMRVRMRALTCLFVVCSL
jgi:hypothetical protein